MIQRIFKFIAVSWVTAVFTLILLAPFVTIALVIKYLTQ